MQNNTGKNISNGILSSITGGGQFVNYQSIKNMKSVTIQ